MGRRNKVLVVAGPTASGKSALAVRLAKKYDGEIISADSRQVYKGLDIGTGKITKKEMAGVPHHLLDVASPKRTFTVNHYQKLAQQKIKQIIKRGRLPIIVGGTGFYIDAALGTISVPPVPPNPPLRKRLNLLTTVELLRRLEKLDPDRAKTIDAKNPRRLIRAIEIAMALGRVPKRQPQPLPYPVIKIGIKVPWPELKLKIHDRLTKRLKQGLIKEVKKLHEKTGLSWQRLESFGLEYRYVAKLLQEQSSNFRVASEPANRWVKREKIATLRQELERAIWHYAKRQLTWFKRDKTINWFRYYFDISKYLQAHLLDKN